MVFTSLPFFVFLILVLSIYRGIGDKYKKIQNLFLLVSSYYFYGYADKRFLLLLAGASLFNYTIAYFISLSQNKFYRKLFFLTGISVNVFSLVLFKYFNFFVESIQNVFSPMLGSFNLGTLELIVPLGISFFTFLSISYIVDVYKNKFPVEKNIVNVLLSLSFFPIILAGPIQRPSTLIPQFKEKRAFDLEMASDGFRQILWGLFVKLVIADNSAIFVDKVFANYSTFNSSTLLFGSILFSIQIYADFSAYSDMAIGISKLFGIKLMRNFNYPYFARDINDFWKRWHISLTTWFRDYIFLPLSFYLSGKIKANRLILISTEIVIYVFGIVITWLLTGLWHGANMTFITWGLIHALFLILFRIAFKARKKWLGRYHLYKDPLIISIERFITLSIVSLAWIFFRSDSNMHALEYINGIFTISLFNLPEFFPTKLIIPICLYFIVEWSNRDKDHGLDFKNTNKPRFIRWTVYYFLIILIFFYQGAPKDFIYFRF